MIQKSKYKSLFLLVCMVCWQGAYAGKGWAAGILGATGGFMLGNAVANSKKPTTYIVEESPAGRPSRYEGRNCRRQLREAEAYIYELEQENASFQRELRKYQRLLEQKDRELENNNKRMARLEKDIEKKSQPKTLSKRKPSQKMAENNLLEEID